MSEDIVALRILNLEDEPLDTELIHAILTDSGISCEMFRVQNRADFLAALEKGCFDLVLSDYSLPSFDGLSALKIVRGIYPEIPFILVSGAIGEERAIEALKTGATDYVLKQRLERLVPAVRRAVREAEERTERNRAEEALRQSEELYRTVVEQAAENIFLVDAGTRRILQANTAFHRSLGYTAEEIRQLTLYDIVAHDPESIDRNVRHVMTQGCYFIGERKYRRKNGSLADTEVSVSAIPYEGREVLCIVAHDITDRKLAEEELRQSEERFRATFEQAAVGVAHVSPDGKWLRVNQKLCDITGYTREELLKHDFQEITHPEDLDADLEQLGRLLAGEIETFSMEKRYIKKDGSVVWINLTVSLARESSGESQYSIAVIQDITKRKEAEEALREVRNAERSRMARDLHDGVLQDLVDVLQSLNIARIAPESLGSSIDLEREVEVLRRAVRGIREAIYDLHPEASRGQRSFVQDVESLVELERRMAPDRDIDLVVTEGFPTEFSGATSRELFRIIQEALTNTRRHSAARHVRVTLGITGDEVWAEVSDDGKGFDPGATRGGMGLTAMQERAFLLGGNLEVIAEPGEGTRVRLRVPRHS
ncbi:MAG: hypothetical protein QOI57_312 [Rubrobacteraceae bacterium]|nr:hypothetical protein [Rubrobacteraceae bacterium]